MAKTMRLGSDFYQQDVLIVAPLLLGKVLVRRFDGGEVRRWKINEVEAYRGEDDLACHARVGKTKRTKVMYEPGGLVYVYLIYGKYWLLNVVTGDAGNPQAVLVRGAKEISGPGRLGVELELDRSFYGEDLNTSNRLWLEEAETGKKNVRREKRVGVDYAGDWAEKKWRWILE